MGKRRTWVLDTETKGTGAEMVPLERLEERKRSRGRREPLRVIARDRDEQPKAPDTEPREPRGPRRFKVVDVLSRQTLAEDASAVETLAVLRDARSVVDVLVYVWEPEEEDWRPLTLSERRTLWDARETATRAA
jgi:hypothetical protein